MVVVDFYGAITRDDYRCDRRFIYCDVITHRLCCRLGASNLPHTKAVSSESIIEPSAAMASATMQPPNVAVDGSAIRKPIDDVKTTTPIRRGDAMMTSSPVAGMTAATTMAVEDGRSTQDRVDSPRYCRAVNDVIATTTAAASPSPGRVTNAAAVVVAARTMTSSSQPATASSSPSDFSVLKYNDSYVTLTSSRQQQEAEEMMTEAAMAELEDDTHIHETPKYLRREKVTTMTIMRLKAPRNGGGGTANCSTQNGPMTLGRNVDRRLVVENR